MTLSINKTLAINKILVANRGEIAVRVMRTAQRMGIRTVAIYSEADAKALHVKSADEAYLVGPAAPRASYLNIKTILEVARKAQCDAVHPGYGFLSENAEFAQACEAEGLVFIGPPATAIRAMGSKSAAKALMEKAGVPLVPGYHGDDQSLDVLSRQASKIGYPVLIKATAGGGGKGMKVVQQSGHFAEALESAKREASKAFGDDRVLIEKYLTQPRHIEVQIFADTLGHYVHLFERDCSIQRRHQKVSEEAPAPGMLPERRAEMGLAAIEAARAVGYVGAGTVEFIAEGEHFYFMEMNTRLQVEHPVTEFITGQDLVEWQIRVARGEPLPKTQQQLSIHGHALEVRLYAEDPERDFLPQTGHFDELHLPANRDGIRVDAGVVQGDDITIHYDPMIAKIVTFGETRDQARARMTAALEETRCVGVATNLQFLQALVAHPAFAAAKLDTGFIGRHWDELKANTTAPQPYLFALAGLAALQRQKELAKVDVADPFSPWDEPTGWRSNQPACVEWLLSIQGNQTLVRAHVAATETKIEVGLHVLSARGSFDGKEILNSWIDGAFRRVRVSQSANAISIFSNGHEHRFDIVDQFASKRVADHSQATVVAPMPGLITRILVELGQKVSKGDGLIIVEAMKMEHTLTAPRDAHVKDIKFNVNDQVREGVELIELEDLHETVVLKETKSSAL